MKHSYDFRRTDDKDGIIIIINNGEKSITIFKNAFGDDVSENLAEEVMKMEKMDEIPLNEILPGTFQCGDGHFLELCYKNRRGSCVGIKDEEIAYAIAFVDLLKELEKEPVWVG